MPTTATASGKRGRPQRARRIDRDGAVYFQCRNPRCARAGEWLAASEFHPLLLPQSTCGRQSQCRRCANIRRRAFERRLRTQGKIASELYAALKESRRTLISAIDAGCDLKDFDATQHVTIKLIDAAIAKFDAINGVNP